MRSAADPDIVATTHAAHSSSYRIPMTTFLLLWLLGLVLAVSGVWLFALSAGEKPCPPATPHVAVVVAVKGHGRDFDAFLDGLFDQAYPFYRVIFAVESKDDAAVPAIEARRAQTPDQVELVVAGPASDEGQKTTNLRAALARVRPTDDVLVLADADIRLERDWLQHLVAPLVTRRADVTTGFPWLVLADRRWSSFALASMAAGVATIPRLPFLNAAWGGSTAMWRERFDALGIASAWRGTLSDDLQLTNVVQKASGRILAPRELLLRTSVTTEGFDDLAAHVRRWYLLVRLHMPVTYWIMVAATTFLGLGWLLAIFGTLFGRADAFAALVLALLFGVLRAGARALLVTRLWGRQGLEENLPFLLADPVLAPLATVLHAGLAWSVLSMRNTTWSGVTYEIAGPQQVKVLAR